MVCVFIRKNSNKLAYEKTCLPHTRSLQNKLSFTWPCSYINRVKKNNIIHWFINFIRGPKELSKKLVKVKNVHANLNKKEQCPEWSTYIAWKSSLRMLEISNMYRFYQENCTQRIAFCDKISRHSIYRYSKINIYILPEFTKCYESHKSNNTNI